jgi:hypothetical protein
MANGSKQQYPHGAMWPWVERGASGHMEMNGLLYIRIYISISCIDLCFVSTHFLCLCLHIIKACEDTVFQIIFWSLIYLYIYFDH